MRTHGPAHHAVIVPGDYTEPGGYRAADVLLTTPDRPLAIFAANDLSALGDMAAAKHLGLTIPEDLSGVGFDNTNLSALGYISLTTVNQPREFMGAAAITS